MKVVLIANVDKLGKVGDAVDVAQGYARNFLIAKGLAVLADDIRAKQVKKEKKVKQRKVKIEQESKREKRLKRQTLQNKKGKIIK